MAHLPRWLRRTSALLTAATLLLLVAAAPARASTIVGANTATTHDFGLACGVDGAPCGATFTIQGLAAAHQAPGGATVPAPGVITSWSMSHGQVRTQSDNLAVASSLTVSLRVIRGAGATGIGAGAGPTETLAQAPGTYSFPARLPVQVGDRIGYDMNLAPGNLVLWGAVQGVPGDRFGSASIWPQGGSPSFYADMSDPPFGSNAYLPMNATVEPDADGDGYGDETQDGCPTNASSHGACPPPPDTSGPQTTITDKPAKGSKKGKAKFGFESSEPGSTFECSLKGKDLDQAVTAFSDCASPRAYRGLDPGKFEFRVRATDAAGNVDPTPAVAKFEIKKQKKG